MTNEFNLSEKIGDVGDEWDSALTQSNVKEFIRLLKEELGKNSYFTLAQELIDKLAGEKLK